jgi:RNA recognition motif-containing protein
MESKLYVGNLSYSATEEELQELFSQAGTVKSVTIVKDRETGRARGFAFVEMGTDAEAQQAINLLNGTNFMERALKINVARPREDRGGRGGGGFDRRRSGGGTNDRRR